jgi:hypothetical protein
VADDHDRFAVQSRRATDDGVVVAVEPVAMEFGEVGKDSFDVIQGLGTVGMTRYLGGLPAGQVGEDLFPHLFRLLFQLDDLCPEKFGGDGYQLLDLFLQFDYRFFKLKVKRRRHRRVSLKQG